jgi:hypothetical protein
LQHTFLTRIKLSEPIKEVVPTKTALNKNYLTLIEQRLKLNKQTRSNGLSNDSKQHLIIAGLRQILFAVRPYGHVSLSNIP